MKAKAILLVSLIVIAAGCGGGGKLLDEAEETLQSETLTSELFPVPENSVPENFTSEVRTSSPIPTPRRWNFLGKTENEIQYKCIDGEVIVKFKGDWLTQDTTPATTQIKNQEKEAIFTLMRKQGIIRYEQVSPKKDTSSIRLDRIYLLSTKVSRDKSRQACFQAERMSRQWETLKELVQYAQPNYVDDKIPYYEPDDQYWGSRGSWEQDFDDLWGLKYLEMDRIWDLAQGEGVIAAVLDTGVDIDHPDIAANIWVNEDEIPDNGIDDDENGYEDDVHGWNFNLNHDDNVISDERTGHGTHVAGTIGATGNNGIGIVGVAFGARIMPIPMLAASTDGAVRAFQYAVDNGANVINCSWGGLYHPTLEDAVRYAYRSGVVVVAAAGNSGWSNDLFPGAPDAFGEAISVGWFRPDRARDPLSNYGFGVDVFAPGGEILSLLSGDLSDEELDYMRDQGAVMIDGTYRVAGGTSMASPHVAGLVADIISYRPELRGIPGGDEVENTIKVEKIRQILRSATDIASPDPIYGGGRVNGWQALNVDATKIPSLYITSPNMLVEGERLVDIIGTATSRDFSSYTLSYGRWDEMLENIAWRKAAPVSTSEVSGGTLGRLDLSGAGYEAIPLKLELTEQTGKKYHLFKNFLIKNADVVYEEISAVADDEWSQVTEDWYQVILAGRINIKIMTVGPNLDGAELKLLKIDEEGRLPGRFEEQNRVIKEEPERVISLSMLPGNRSSNPLESQYILNTEDLPDAPYLLFAQLYTRDHPQGQLDRFPYFVRIRNDKDGDGVPNRQDNCPEIPNPDQGDSDQDGIGDYCEEDVHYPLFVYPTAGREFSAVLHRDGTIGFTVHIYEPDGDGVELIQKGLSESSVRISDPFSYPYHDEHHHFFDFAVFVGAYREPGIFPVTLTVRETDNPQSQSSIPITIIIEENPDTPRADIEERIEVRVGERKVIPLRTTNGQTDGIEFSYGCEPDLECLYLVYGLQNGQRFGNYNIDALEIRPHDEDQVGEYTLRVRARDLASGMEGVVEVLITVLPNGAPFIVGRAYPTFPVRSSDVFLHVGERLLRIYWIADPDPDDAVSLAAPSSWEDEYPLDPQIRIYNCDIDSEVLEYRGRTYYLHRVCLEFTASEDYRGRSIDIMLEAVDEWGLDSDVCDHSAISFTISVETPNTPPWIHEMNMQHYDPDLYDDQAYHSGGRIGEPMVRTIAPEERDIYLTVPAEITTAVSFLAYDAEEQFAGIFFPFYSDDTCHSSRYQDTPFNPAPDIVEESHWGNKFVFNPRREDIGRSFTLLLEVRAHSRSTYYYVHVNMVPFIPTLNIDSP